MTAQIHDGKGAGCASDEFRPPRLPTTRLAGLGDHARAWPYPFLVGDDGGAAVSNRCQAQ